MLGNLRADPVADHSAESQTFCLSKLRVQVCPVASFALPFLSNYLPPPFILSPSFLSIILWSWLGRMSHVVDSQPPSIHSFCLSLPLRRKKSITFLAAPELPLVCDCCCPYPCPSSSPYASTKRRLFFCKTPRPFWPC